jgi:hypothetical protein
MPVQTPPSELLERIVRLGILQSLREPVRSREAMKVFVLCRQLDDMLDTIDSMYETLDTVETFDAAIVKDFIDEASITLCTVREILNDETLERQDLDEPVEPVAS